MRLAVQGSVYGRTAIFEWSQEEIPSKVKLISLTGGTFYASDGIQTATLSAGQTFTRSADATTLSINLDSNGNFAQHSGVVEVYY